MNKTGKMRRFLAWLTLVGCWWLFSLIVALDMLLLTYLLSLFVELTTFLKLVVIILGGSFFLGLAIAPLWYGIPLTLYLSQKVCPTRYGDRYVIFGVLICCSAVGEIIISLLLLPYVHFFFWPYFLYGLLSVIYGLAVLIQGKCRGKLWSEETAEEIDEDMQAAY